MRIFGIEINKAETIDQIQNNYLEQLRNVNLKDANLQEIHKKLEDIEKKYAELGGNMVVRPNLDTSGTSTGTDGLFYPIENLSQLYEISYISDYLTICQRALNGEIFRNGLEVVPAFKAKCLDCGSEIEHPDEDMKCDKCQGDLYEPDPLQYIQAKSLIDSPINFNGQYLKDTEKEGETHHAIADDTYMLYRKQYIYDSEGKIISQKNLEVVSCNSEIMRIIADKQGNYGYLSNGKKALVCPEHRDLLQAGPKCSKCGLVCVMALYVATGTPTTYYIAGEIWHKNSYRPSMTYGFPPVLTVYYKARIMIGQDRTALQTTEKQRPPKGMLVFPGTNAESLKKAYQSAVDFVKTNPGTIPILALESNQMNGKNSPPQFFDFMRSASEMQLMEQKKEYKETIGALYGVMPIFQADTSTSGGLNNEGQQITVTVRAAEENQNFWNNFHDWLCEQNQITDWKIRLKAVEEKDKAAEIDLKMKHAVYAQQMKMLGFNIEMLPDGSFKFSGDPNAIQDNPPETMPPQEPMSNRRDGQPEKIDKSSDLKKNFFSAPKNSKFQTLLKKKIVLAKRRIALILENYLSQRQIFDIKKTAQDNLKIQMEKILNPEDIKNSVYSAIALEFSQGTESFEKKFGINTMPNQRALQFLQEYTFSNIKGMTDDLANKLRGEISRGIMEGLGKAELAKNINAILEVGKTRSNQIALETTTRAYAQGAFTAAKDSGITLKKYVFNPDPKTEICQYLTSQEPIPIDESFSYGGESWMTEPFHFGCRSETLYEEDKEE